MQRMKMLTLAVCMFSTPMVLARPQAAQQPAPPQAGPHMPPSVEERMARLSKELDLSQEQRDKIRPLIEEQVKQLHELRENTNLTPDQRREKAGALMKETHEKIAAVLNPEQKEKLKQHMEQMREHHAAEHKESPAKQ